MDLLESIWRALRVGIIIGWGRGAAAGAGPAGSCCCGEGNVFAGTDEERGAEPGGWSAPVPEEGPGLRAEEEEEEQAVEAAPVSAAGAAAGIRWMGMRTSAVIFASSIAAACCVAHGPWHQASASAAIPARGPLLSTAERQASWNGPGPSSNGPAR